MKPLPERECLVPPRGKTVCRGDVVDAALIGKQGPLNELVDKRSSKCAIAQESLLERDRVLGPALLSAVS